MEVILSTTKQKLKLLGRDQQDRRRWSVGYKWKVISTGGYKQLGVDYQINKYITAMLHKVATILVANSFFPGIVTTIQAIS